MRRTGQADRVIARSVILFGWVVGAGAAETPIDTPAAVTVEAAPAASPVVADELPPVTVSHAERIDRFALEGPRFLDKVTRLPISTLRALASFRGESVRKATNPHDPIKVDEFRTFTFDGLEIYGFMGDKGDLWPIRITVSGPAWDIADGLRVGSDAARAVSRLGEPTNRGPEVWQFQGEFQNVNFHVRDDRIEKIEFIYYLD